MTPIEAPKPFTYKSLKDASEASFEKLEEYIESGKWREVLWPETEFIKSTLIILSPGDDQSTQTMSLFREKLLGANYPVAVICPPNFNTSDGLTPTSELVKAMGAENLIHQQIFYLENEKALCFHDYYVRYLFLECEKIQEIAKNNGIKNIVFVGHSKSAGVAIFSQPRIMNKLFKMIFALSPSQILPGSMYKNAMYLHKGLSTPSQVDTSVIAVHDLWSENDEGIMGEILKLLPKQLVGQANKQSIKEHDKWSDLLKFWIRKFWKTEDYSKRLQKALAEDSSPESFQARELQLSHHMTMLQSEKLVNEFVKILDEHFGGENQPR